MDTNCYFVKKFIRKFNLNKITGKKSTINIYRHSQDSYSKILIFFVLKILKKNIYFIYDC